MGYEIDFLPVGDGKKCGDAIAVRYGEPGNYTVMVYDGGTLSSGVALVEHVRQYYNTNHVHHVVNSHPDQDHSSGLSVVLEEMTVGTLWMHRPWQHSHLILDYFKDGRITSDSLKERLQNKMSAAYNLEQIATRKGITIIEPFQGANIGIFYVLSPDKEWYIHELISDFEKSPLQKSLEAISVALDSTKLGIFGRFTEAAKRTVAKWVTERWDIELLRENVETSAENESSAILYAYVQDCLEGVILTGDAGVRALNRAVDYLQSHNIDPATNIHFYQIPHHGGRHNVSTSVLDRLVGPRLPTMPVNFTKTAFVSASQLSDYPRNMVKNAFLRRGVDVSWTKGQGIHRYHNMPTRGWGALERAQFSPQVESWE